ncbi:MAG: AAA family ATPase [Candidatus Zhuqueibacterota bacterium]
MSDIRIEVSAETPFFHIHPDAEKKYLINEIFYHIKKSLYSKNLQEKICFIYFDGKSSELQELIKSSYLDIVLLGRADIVKVVFSDHKRAMLVKLISEQHGISIISPFSYTRVPTGGMFYGRKEQMNKLIRSNFETNFAVVGSRRIGKTTILLNLKRHFDQEKLFHAIFLDCYRIQNISEFITKIVTELDVRSSLKVNISTFHDFMSRMKSRFNKNLVLILDEIDELLEYDKTYNWQLSRIFHSLASEIVCKIIIAGYRRLYQEINNQHSPFFKYFEQIQIKELDDTSARQLILEPLDDIGVKIKDRAGFSEMIMHLSSNHPQFIQFFCSLLIDLVNKENRNEVTKDDVLKLEGQDEYFHFVMDTFLINTDQFQQLIVYEMAQYNSFDEQLVIEKLKENYQVDLSITSIQKDCVELELANILKREKSVYKFAYPALPKILNSDFNLTFRKQAIAREILAEGKYYVK